MIFENINAKDDESLAWGSIHLQCERIMRLHEDLARKGSTNENTTTSISRSAFTVFSCRPVVLFCELLLHAGELREFVCTQQLPLESIPPSFKFVYFFLNIFHLLVFKKQPSFLYNYFYFLIHH